jgi:hypothetical protein
MRHQRAGNLRPHSMLEAKSAVWIFVVDQPLEQ